MMKKVIDVRLNLETIVSYQIVTSKDTYKNLQNGMIASKLIEHDIYHKKLDLHKYDYLSNFDTDIHPDEWGVVLSSQPKTQIKKTNYR